MARKKKIVEDVEIVDFGFKGKAIGKDKAGQVYLIDNAVPGDVVDVLVLRKKKGMLAGFPKNYKTFSPERVEAQCGHFGVCGGCAWMKISYEAQLKYKEKSVLDAMQRIGKLAFKETIPILPSVEQVYYRNKLEFTFSDKRWITQEEAALDITIENRDALGFHRPGAFDKIVDIDHCYLQGGISNEIRNSIRVYAKENGLSFYNITGQSGLLRTLIIRTTTLGEVMVIVTLGREDREQRIGLLTFLKEKFGEQITSLNYVINTKGNDTIYDQDVVCFNGQAFITEKLGETKYQIGPKSFFQTNPLQAEKLYEIAVAFADLKPTDLVYDLYTGLGSIALFLAKDVKEVVGIEEIPEAIVYAIKNAELNNLSNTHFYAGDVKALLTKDLIEKHGKPDVLITDPPRVGMHEDVVRSLIYLRIPKIVYVSCNAATQARDLNLLKEVYSLEKIQAVDMFPHTNHVESVALLKLLDE